MELKKISELKDKDPFEGPLLVKEKNISVGKNGRPFMSLMMGDSSGQIDARVWDNVDSLSSEFDVGDVVQLKGLVQLFQNRRQLIVHKIDKLDQSTIQFDDFIPKSTRKPEDLFTEVLVIARTIKNQSLQRLTLDVLEDPEIKQLLLKSPAAKTIHHAWIGGLLEHILSILQIMDFMAKHYQFLNRDLLIFGAIFHDIGKIWELTWSQGIQYTQRGRLIGHMEMACELVDKKASRIMGFDQSLIDICKHIILSHHGKLEYGSPKLPMFPEAFLVSMIDDLDSKMSTIFQLISQERGANEGWSRYHEAFQRSFMLDDLKVKFEG